MVEWCPRCHAMLTPGLERCPRCNKRLRRQSGSDYTARDVFWLTLNILGYTLIPVLIVIIVAALCIYLLK